MVYRRREKGRVRPGTMMSGTPARGVLEVTEGRADAMHRLCRVARLVGPRGEIALPLLHDVVLLFARKDLWSLGGYEFEDESGVGIAYGQTWFLIPAQYFEQEASLVAEAAALQKAHQHEQPEFAGRTGAWSKSKR